MPVSEACQACGTAVSRAFARVFGNNSDDAHACLGCTSKTALQHGAAVAPDRDGTPLVHRPDGSNPQPVTTDDPVTDESDEEVIHLEDVRHRDHARGTRDDSFSHTDSEFEALVAE